MSQRNTGRGSSREVSGSASVRRGVDGIAVHNGDNLGVDWIREGDIFFPVPKVAISIRLDEDVLQWFKDQGPGYQSRINAVLRAYVKAHK